MSFGCVQSSATIGGFWDNNGWNFGVRMVDFGAKLNFTCEMH